MCIVSSLQMIEISDMRNAYADKWCKHHKHILFSLISNGKRIKTLYLAFKHSGGLTRDFVKIGPKPRFLVQKSIFSLKIPVFNIQTYTRYFQTLSIHIESTHENTSKYAKKVSERHRQYGALDAAKCLEKMQNLLTESRHTGAHRRWNFAHTIHGIQETLISGF